ncbi:ribonucleases P/MRP protein subunit pop1 [Acrasis kona]|uniref:Ribonucleases P/MRP protein subunit pop1 n=1 Tax=Acrasis kona TaxID=1008807 RepID=A0AAW2ZB92_9EUKA
MSKVDQADLYDYKRYNRVNINEFIAVREGEIKKLQNALSEGGHKRIFQTLPRHLRRRQMSHNPHLVPKVLREGAIRESSLPNKVKQRRRRKIRKRNIYRLIQAKTFSRFRSGCIDTPFDDIPLTPDAKIKPKRLTTHLFHAKRMHMKNKWGFRIADKNIAKIYRTAYRFNRQHCTIHDASYLICIQLSSNSRESIVSTLTTLLAKGKKSVLFTQGMFGPDAKREGEFIGYSGDSCVGPIKFMWMPGMNPKHHFSCMLWSHPSSIQESWNHISDQSQKNDVECIYRNDLSRLQVRGPSSTTVLRNSIKVHEDLCSSASKHSWSIISHNNMMSDSLPQSMILSLPIHHPLVKETKIISTFTQQKKPTPSEMLFLTIPNEIHSYNLLWEKQAYTSNRLNQNKEPVSSFCLIQSENGWDVICPMNVTVHLWDKLSKQKNVLPLGISDKNHIQTENGTSVFPNDYIQSSAFFREFSNHDESVQKMIRYKNVISDEPVHIVVDCAWGGTPEPGDVLYQVEDVLNHEERYNAICEKNVKKTPFAIVTSGLYSLTRGRGFAKASAKPDLAFHAPVVRRKGARIDQRLAWLHKSQHLHPVVFRYDDQ